jgi:diaminopimelate epimerase
MRIDFTKMHGLGNDFIVFDAPLETPLPDAEQFRHLAARHTGIGFDQALVLEEPRRPGTHLYYRIFNADGDEVEQCGNGARCIAALAHRRGRVPLHQVILMDSLGGLVPAQILAPDLVAVEMGIPNFAPESLPFDAEKQAQSYTLEVAGNRMEIGAVSIGNPHALLTVESVDDAAVERLGSAIGHHRRFPAGVNVGFMQVVDRATIRLRVYERGVGETLACGTGACAAVAIGRSRGLLGSDVNVQVRGGELRVNWEGAGNPVWLTGPAVVSFEGHVELSNNAGAET